MRGPFWPEQAWKSIVGNAWPWLNPEPQAAFVARLRGTLDSYWAQRLAAVPPLHLSESARNTLLGSRAEVVPETPLAGGFEKVAEASTGNADAFWFLDLGCAAWILRLGELRREKLLPGRLEEERYQELEDLWASQGPAAALQWVEAWFQKDRRHQPGLSLYYVPLALWQKRDAAVAISHLDRGVSALSSRGQTVLGETLPLSYGLLLALQGEMKRAEAILSETEILQEYAAWVGFHHPEVRYHRARYLWALGQQKEARELLERVMHQQPSYVLRALTDPALLLKDGTRDGELSAQISEAVDRSRSELMRWQHSRPEREPNATAQAHAQRIVTTLRQHGGESYIVMAAAAGVRKLKGEESGFTPSFRSDYQTLLNFAESLPSSFPLHLGPGFGPRFVDTERSDISQLQALVDSNQVSEATRLLRRISMVLPGAVRMACISYAARMVRALATAADTLEVREAEVDEHRLHQLHVLWEACFQLADPIRSLPDETGPALSAGLKSVWNHISDIEEAWVASEGRAYGQMQLLPPEVVPPIRRGTFSAYHFEVRDAAGTPVPGVPVLWRVISGPARPKDPSENVDLEWASSLQTGRVVVALEAFGGGTEGEIEARLLGSRRAVRVGYRVES